MTSASGPPSELLLGRPEFAGDLVAAAAWLRGRRVLVTGAAGSIGTPLALLLTRVEPDRLVLVDHHEYSLFSLERSLGSAGDALAYELADVRDTKQLEGIFGRYQPEVVVHLAAAKHVPYGERFPEQAIEVNVLAAERLIRMARERGVERFVYPSSDKSVDPPSLYGATKRLAEGLVQSSATQPGWAVVRYVNIIGTRGSVVETFTQQVLADRPLTVTDERMTRYWISMDEALWCIIAAADRAAAGDVVMPACGEPVPLLETARRLADWYRPEQQPYPIHCTGVRPGERLHEVLLSANESLVDGPVPGVHRVTTRRDPACLGSLPAVIDELQAHAAARDREALVRTAMRAAIALQ